MTITSSAVLVELNISVWTANKLDRDQTAKVNEENSAGRNAAQVRKNLMAGSQARKQIADYAAGCRLWHNHKTLPWSDKGVRLMPTSLFMDYKSEANVRRATFDGMVKEFLDNYQNHVEVAKNNSEGLGRLYDPADYPSEEEVRGKFGFRLVFSPVPESGDFRLDVPRGEMEELRKQYEESFENRLSEAMRDRKSVV